MIPANREADMAAAIAAAPGAGTDDAAGATTIDRFLGGRVTVLQPAARGHRAGLDAVLLGAAVPADATGTIVDLGAGVGVAGLVAAARCAAAQVVLVEVDPATAGLARRSLALNDPELAGRVQVAIADATSGLGVLAAAGLAANTAAHVILNPPFHPADRSRASPDPARAAAHRIDPADLERWLRTAASLCHARGRVTVIYRADELPRLLHAMTGRFGGISALPVQPREGAPASRVIVRGSPGSRAPFALLPPLVLHGAGGAYTSAADAILKGEAALPG